MTVAQSERFTQHIGFGYMSYGCGKRVAARPPKRKDAIVGGGGGGFEKEQEQEHEQPKKKKRFIGLAPSPSSFIKIDHRWPLRSTLKV